MKILDNSEQIKNLLDFTQDGTFYFLQVYRRQKDQIESDDQKADNVLIKDYFIKSIDHFDKLFPEIKELCHYFNARAYIRLNRCFHEQVGMETLSTIVEYMKLGNWHNIKVAYTTACGRRCYDPEKKWIIDVDFDKDYKIDEDDLIKVIENSNSGFEKNIVAKIPTVNGFHWITHPFDTRELSNVAPKCDIHKNNPTLLYFYKI